MFENVALLVVWAIAAVPFSMMITDFIDKFIEPDSWKGVPPVDKLLLVLQFVSPLGLVTVPFWLAKNVLYPLFMAVCFVLITPYRLYKFGTGDFADLTIRFLFGATILPLLNWLLFFDGPRHTAIAGHEGPLAVAFAAFTLTWTLFFMIEFGWGLLEIVVGWCVEQYRVTRSEVLSQKVGDDHDSRGGLTEV